MAFKMKSSFEKKQEDMISKAKNIIDENQRNLNLQKVLHQLFDDDSSSDEEDEKNYKSNCSIYQKFTMNYQYKQNYFFQNIYRSEQKSFYGKTEESKSSLPPKQTEKKFIPFEKDKKIIEKIRKKEPIFSVLKNQIRKKK